MSDDPKEWANIFVALHFSSAQVKADAMETMPPAIRALFLETESSRDFALLGLCVISLSFFPVMTLAWYFS